MTRFALFELLIASQCLVLPLFLARKGRWRLPSNRFLIALLLMFGADAGFEAIQRINGTLRVTPVTLLAVLFGPAVWGFVRSVAFPERHWRRRDLLHGVPYLIVVAVHFAGKLGDDLRSAIAFLSLWSYLAATLRLRWSYRHVLRSTRSDLTEARAAWIDFVAFGFLVLNLLDVAAVVAGRWVPWADGILVRSVFLVVLFLYIVGFVLLALEWPTVLFGISVAEQSAADAPPVAQPLAPEDQAELDRIEATMVARELYLDPDLTLPELAEVLGVPARRLSALVNRARGRNFCDWVNRYRVEEAARRLSGPTTAGDNVLDVLYASGFNSKSSFNAAFKRVKGMTPSDFRRAARG
jgi:AraC-like DNA-binding protein